LIVLPGWEFDQRDGLNFLAFYLVLRKMAGEFNRIGIERGELDVVYLYDVLGGVGTFVAKDSGPFAPDFIAAQL